MVLKVTPAWLIDKGTRIWPSFHTTGRWELERKILGLLGLAGAKNARVEHSECRTRGANACVYDVDWS